jgi:hypothetical protein
MIITALRCGLGNVLSWALFVLKCPIWFLSIGPIQYAMTQRQVAMCWRCQCTVNLNAKILGILYLRHVHLITECPVWEQAARNETLFSAEMWSASVAVVYVSRAKQTEMGAKKSVSTWGPCSTRGPPSDCPKGISRFSMPNKKPSRWWHPNLQITQPSKY